MDARAMDSEPSPRCPNCENALRPMPFASNLYRVQIFECEACDISVAEAAEDLELTALRGTAQTKSSEHSWEVEL
jgi:hypothetical protein